VLRGYQQYYNGTRTHLALAKDSPLTRSVQAVGRILPLLILGGLHHRYAGSDCDSDRLARRIEVPASASGTRRMASGALIQ
jgi:hypothetical protein